MLTYKLIITFLLIIYLSQYMTGIQPFHLKGGFNAWMGIDSFLGSHARLIPSTQTGRVRVWTAAQYSRGKRSNWFFFANSISWKTNPCACISTSGRMYLYTCGCASGCGVWSVVGHNHPGLRFLFLFFPTDAHSGSESFGFFPQGQLWT